MNSKSNVLPIVKVTDLTGVDHFINVYQISKVYQSGRDSFCLHVNNAGTVQCNGNAKEFVKLIINEGAEKSCQ